jgi:hypothetical protein
MHRQGNGPLVCPFFMQRAEKGAVSGFLLMLFKLYIFTSRASEHRGIYADLVMD